MVVKVHHRYFQEKSQVASNLEQVVRQARNGRSKHGGRRGERRREGGVCCGWPGRAVGLQNYDVDRWGDGSAAFWARRAMMGWSRRPRARDVRPQYG